MKYKIGQKVRVKEWVDMPEELLANWGRNCLVGHVGVIVEYTNNGYDVMIGNDKYPAFCLQGEIEPLIKVGQQLVFPFVEE